jgi:hypothetical protein
MVSQVLKLQMPVFHEDLSNWLSFCDLLVSAVHNNGALGSSQGLQCLKAQVKGEPALLLQSIAIIDANYVEAWKLLTEQYQDRRELVNATLKWLFALNQYNKNWLQQ